MVMIKAGRATIFGGTSLGEVVWTDSMSAPWLSIRFPETPNANLHRAVSTGNVLEVEQIIAADPNLIDEVDWLGSTPLHYAVKQGHEAITDMLLAARPSVIRAVDNSRCTVLHIAIQSKRSALVIKIWELFPEALRAVNIYDKTPFQLALAGGLTPAVERLQMSLSLDEIVNAFTSLRRDYVEPLKPVMQQQCECLVDLLTQDVVGTVFEYLGFEPVKKPAPALATVPPKERVFVKPRRAKV